MTQTPTTIDMYLKNKYQNKYKAAQQDMWISTSYTNCTAWRKAGEVKDITQFIHDVAGNNAPYGAYLI
eukprot:11792874-Ditylum_brightwellii.AAC.1